MSREHDGLGGSVSPASVAEDASAGHIRSSALLLTGRIAATALNFLSGVLLVRYFSKADYGTLSYIMATVAFLQALATFQMSGTLARFIPAYRENNRNPEMFGSILLAFGIVFALSALIIAAVYWFLDAFGYIPLEHPQAVSLILILVLLIPSQAADDLFTSLFAAFGKSRAILLRQSVLAPGLKLLAVLLLIAFEAGVLFIAVSYVVISLIGLGVYIGLFVRLLRQHGWNRASLAEFSLPGRDMLGYATPMMFSTLVWIVMDTSSVLLLGYLKDAEAVASFRAVQPIAQLNLLVSTAFATLFVPVAARLHARENHGEVSRLYWNAAIWMTVLTFPIFIITFSFAGPTTTTLLGSRYSDSIPILGVLSVGYFAQTIFGFNGVTLKVYRKIGYVIKVSVLALVVNLCLIFILIPPFGPVGAAIATCTTMIVHNLLKQYGLKLHTSVDLINRRALFVIALAFTASLVLLVSQALYPLGLLGAVLTSAAAALLLLWGMRRTLELDSLFPELRRWPMIRAVFAR